MTLIGRPQDATTAAITTAVVMVVAGVSPHDAWRQPVLRLADPRSGSSWASPPRGSACAPSGSEPPGAQRDEQPVITKQGGSVFGASRRSLPWFCR